MPQRGPLKWWQESELVRVKIQSTGFQLYRLVQEGWLELPWRRIETRECVVIKEEDE